MIYLICLLIVLLLIIIFVYSYKNSRFVIRNNIVQSLWLACFTYSLILGIPPLFRCDSKFNSIISIFYFALHSMVGDADLSIFKVIALDRISCSSVSIICHCFSWIYRGVLAIVLICGPLFTTTILAKALGLSVAALKFKGMMLSNRKIHIFSELNEFSVSLAEDIYKKSRASQIVFCDVNEKESGDDLYRRCRNIRGLTVTYSILQITIPKNLYLRNKKISVYLIGRDEAKNHKNLHDINNKWLSLLKNRITEQTTGLIEIITFSTWQSASLLVDTERNIIAQNIILNNDSEIKPHLVYRLRLINDMRIACYNLLYEYPFIEKNTGISISILLVGLGTFGREMLKALCWCTVLKDRNVSIYVADKNVASIKNELMLECPELNFNKHNVTFYNGSVLDYRFSQFLENNCPTLDYAIISAGDDSSTLSIGIYLSRLYLSRKEMIKPRIALRMHDDLLADSLKIISNGTSESHMFHVFGTTPALYKVDKLFNSRLEQSAENLHIITNTKIKQSNILEGQYDSEIADIKNKYWSSEYYQRSSYASALHLLYKKLQFSYGQMLSEEEVKEEAKIEHDRWCTYMQTEGYKKASISQMNSYYNEVNNHVNHSAKLTPCLVPWDELESVFNSVRKFNSKIVNFKEKDKAVIRYVLENDWNQQ